MSCIVPRTCTEVQPPGGGPTGAAARQGSGTTRRHGVGPGEGEPHDADYPIDRDALSRPLADFRTVPAYVLLGDPGSGKTTSFDAERSALGPAACPVTARDFLTFDPGVHPEWRGKTLFIDELDEVRAGSGDARRPLDAIRGRLDALGRPPFRLSCREADWLGAEDRTSLVKVSPHDSLTVLRLDPLADQDIERILNEDAGIEDAVAFMAEAEERGVEGLLQNPQCLRMLADVVKNGGGWPESRLALFERACLRMARSYIDEHDAGGASRHYVAASEDDVLDAAGRLCAVILLSGARGCAIARRHEDADHPHLNRCVRRYEGPCRQAMGTNLFRAEAEAEAEGRFQPLHRHVAEFLAGRHLARLVEGGGRHGRDGRRGIPLRRVLALMTGHDGGVATALRGLSAWLAAQSGTARRELVERDPIGVGVYGDASGFSPPEKVTLLRALAQARGQLERLLTASPLDGGQPTSALGALVAPATEPALRDMLADPRRDNEHQTLVVVLLHLLTQGAALPGLSPLLFDLVRDETRPASVRRFALDALIHRSRRDDDLREGLARLLSDVRAGTIADPDDQLLGALLIRLYPGGLTPADLWTHLSESAGRFFGSFYRFWRSHLPAEVPVAELPAHLDLLAARRDQLRPVLESRGLGSLPADLLARALDVQGEKVDAKRLYDWLGVGAGVADGSDAWKTARDWLTERPRIQEAILVESVERGARSGEDELHPRVIDAERRLRGARRPSDFERWCLERAEEATDPRVADAFLHPVCRVLENGNRLCGLTLDEVIGRARSHPVLASVFEKRRACELPPDYLEIRRRSLRAEGARERERRKWLEHARAHETALRENRCPPSLLHAMAAACLGLLADVVGETPTARLRDLFRGDERLVAAAWSGFRQAIDRDDLPDVDEIVRLCDRGQRHALALPVLVGMAEAGRAGTVERSRLDDRRVRSLLAFHYCTPGAWGKPWLPRVVRSRPHVAADVLVQCAVPALRRHRRDVPGLDEIMNGEDHAAVVGHAALPLLRAFPLRRAVRGGRLDALLWAALRHADGGSLLALIADKCSRKSLSTAQRVRWLSAGAIASPEEYVGRLEDCVDRQAERARHVAAFFAAATVGPIRTVELEEEGLFLDVLDEAHRRSVASLLGERLGARGLGRLIRLTASIRSPHPGVTALTWGLAVLPDSGASEVLKSLASDPALSAWEAELVRARDDQLAVRRDAAYRRPDVEQVCRALEDGPPANAGDLAALVTDRLDEIGVRIGNDNANGWRPFWNEDEYGRRDTPKHEGACRDALRKELQYLLPQGVGTEPEVRYANDRRADIRVACRGFQVPVEIKKNGHRHLWSALREQLVARYARDPATDGYGIYVVLWFGEVDGCRTPPPPSGVRPRGPEALGQRLQDTLTREEARKISVCVVDVSAPAADGP